MVALFIYFFNYFYSLIYLVIYLCQVKTNTAGKRGDHKNP